MVTNVSTRSYHAFKRMFRDQFAQLTASWIALRWLVHNARFSKPHNLDAPLVVSLTSYPPRFPVLQRTLQSLLMQTTKPDHLILWIADKDVRTLPVTIWALVAHGLSIKTCSDIGSYKKIMPTLISYPDAVIVTADDDVYYWPTWLEELVSAYKPGAKEVLCHRAHQIIYRADGRPAPYRDWKFETANTNASKAIFPTGLGGILYRPSIFTTDVTQKERFQTYCPSADDIWLFWMASLNGAQFRKVGPVRRFVLWKGGQDVALYNHNVLGTDANDKQIGAMIAAYGLPMAGKTS